VKAAKRLRTPGSPKCLKPLNGVLEGREKLSTAFGILDPPSGLLASFQDAFRELQMFRGDPVVVTTG
jgi:hypothetical protein